MRTAAGSSSRCFSASTSKTGMSLATWATSTSSPATSGKPSTPPPDDLRAQLTLAGFGGSSSLHPLASSPQFPVPSVILIAMCGRFTLTKRDFQELTRMLGVDPADYGGKYRPRYNIAPTDPHWIVRM